MIGVLLLDAITRNVINYPLHWCVEFAQFTLAAYYFMGGAMTLKDNDHVRMDLFYERLSGARQGPARCRHDLLPDLLPRRDAVGSISSLIYAIETGETRFSMWNPSMIPIKALMVACIVLMILQSVSLLFKMLAPLRRETAA